MGVYSFKPQFTAHILSGRKKHTIRKKRKDGWVEKPGNTMYLYENLRTKQSKHIGDRECVKVEAVEIKALVIDRETDDGGEDEHIESAIVQIDGQELSEDECESLSRRDGFSSFREMLKFWTEPKNRLPFSGHIIYWK
jgi:hypothetical protein